MKSIDEVERLLRETPTPCVVEGPHREQLKQRLLLQAPSILQEEDKMRLSTFARMSPALKVAAVILAAVLLVGAGWAAEKIYESLKFTQASLILDEYPGPEWKLPNGKELTTAATTITVINPNDPNATATAQRHQKEIQDLVGQKKYKLLRTFRNEFSGATEYVYRFTMSDGTQHNMNFSMPLENVASWDEYLRNEQEQRKNHQQQVNNAVAAGKFRLIDQDVILIHICMARESERKIKVQRISLRDGKEIALYLPYNLTEEEQATPKPQSSWREHLQAIREGKLELLDVETVPNYTYEVVCEDGTKRIFNYGGGDPLERPKAK